MILKVKKVIYPKNPEADYKGFVIMFALSIEKQTDIMVKGSGLPLCSGTVFDAEGEFKKDKYGEAYNVTGFLPVIGVDEKSIIDAICSITEEDTEIAEAVYSKYKAESIEKLDAEPKLLLNLKGICPRKKRRAYYKYIENRLSIKYMRELKKCGIPTYMAVKLINAHKDGAVTTAKEHAYQMCEVCNVNFKTVDALIKKNGLKSSYTEKVYAALYDVFLQAENGGPLFRSVSGHCCVSVQDWIEMAASTLKVSSQEEKDKFISLARKYVLQHNKVYLDRGSDNTIYATREKTYWAETNTAQYIVSLLKANDTSNASNLDSEIAIMEEKVGFSLTNEQRNAVETALNNLISVITGGPGTGKSTILNFIRTIYAKKNTKGKILLLAPTGKAARRMQETTGCRSLTIHRGLQLKVDNAGEFGEPIPIDADFILIDEISMLDIFIAEKLFKSIKPGTKVVLVGDVDQLPSVGAGAVLDDLIDSNIIPLARLTQAKRQAGDSHIILNSFLMKNGNYDLEYADDFILDVTDNFEQAAEEVDKIFLKEVKRVGINNVVMLSPYRKKGTATSVEDFNTRIHDQVNPPIEGKPYMYSKGTKYREGDKVMQTSNTNDVSNGDVGYITEISGGKVTIDFDGRVVEYDKNDMDNVVLAYATTVHKSQGSEYKVVIFNIQNEHGMLKKRNLIYTAVTRAKEKVYIVGSKKALVDSINHGTTGEDRRKTLLAQRIKALCEEN